MEGEEEDIIEPQEEECLENEPEEHRDEGWNGHYPKTPTNGNSFDIINVLLDENDGGYDLPAAPHPLGYNITVKLQPLTFQASPLSSVHRYSPKSEYEFTYMMPMHRKRVRLRPSSDMRCSKPRSEVGIQLGVDIPWDPGG